MINKLGVKNSVDNDKALKNWIKKYKKNKGIKGLNKHYSQHIFQFVNDMSLGLNVSKRHKRGPRTSSTIIKEVRKIIFVLKRLQERNITKLDKIKREDLHTIFRDMREGIIQNSKTGGVFFSASDYEKGASTFWHWYMKVSKTKLEDITDSLEKTSNKPRFIYLSQERVEEFVKKAPYDLKLVISLAFDSGARPKELLNIKVGDFSNDYKELNIREETAKTFGRKIKIMLCSEQVKEYVKKLDLEKEEFLIQMNAPAINKALRKLAREILTKEEMNGCSMSLYDLRHDSCCFWLPRYKSESALKYRFGWKKSDMIYYYSELLGMKDTIRDEDLYLDVTKSELEKDIKKERKARLKLEKEVKELKLKYPFTAGGKNPNDFIEQNVKDIIKKQLVEIQKLKVTCRVVKVKDKKDKLKRQLIFDLQDENIPTDERYDAIMKLYKMENIPVGIFLKEIGIDQNLFNRAKNYVEDKKEKERKKS